MPIRHTHSTHPYVVWSLSGRRHLHGGRVAPTRVQSTLQVDGATTRAGLIASGGVTVFWPTQAQSTIYWPPSARCPSNQRRISAGSLTRVRLPQVRSNACEKVLTTDSPDISIPKIVQPAAFTML